MKSGRNSVTRSFYDSLVAAFRETPGNASAAGRAIGCNPRMAARGWQLGWPRYDWAIPIRDVLAQEKIQALARAREAEVAKIDQAEEDREKARQAAIEAKRQEMKILDVARADVLAVVTLAGQLVAPMAQAVKVITAAMANVGPNGLPTISAPSAMQMLVRHATLLQKAVGCAEALIQLSRLERGETTANIGVSAQDDMSVEEALEELEALSAITGNRARAVRIVPRPSDLLDDG